MDLRKHSIALLGCLSLATIACMVSRDGSADEKTASAEKKTESVEARAASGESAPSAVGRKAADFVLTDATGKQVALSDYREKKAVALFFMGTSCPIANLYLPTLTELQKKFDGKGVQIIGVQSNPGLTLDEVAEHAKEHKFTLPVLHDADQQVAKQLQAKRTGEVFLLDAQRIVRYHGRVDDRYGYTYKRDEPRRNDLEIAITELLEDHKIAEPETAAKGCLLTWKDRPAAHSNVTYSREVSRILQKRCAECHREGMVAPFALSNYDDAVEWSAMMKEVVLQRRMPPWHADPRYGDFSNNRRMPQEEVDQLIAWIDSNKPQGDPKELPPPPKYAEGWQIEQPDYVFELPKEVTVPAKGTVPYMYFSVPTNFKEDVWVQAAEARPGNRAVVHHIIVFCRDPNKRGRQRGILEDNLVGTAPGDPPTVFPPGSARKIPAGSELIFQMHYTPNGKEQTDRSQVGLVLYKGKEPPKYNIGSTAIINQRFRIPAGDPNHLVESKRTFQRDTLIFSFMPHMHVRGKDFLFRANYPDGRSEILLSIPAYDFNWQNSYTPTKPLLIPKGTTLECVAHFDNSAGNPANPDPTKEVRWGDQTWEEMMIGWLGTAPAQASQDDGASD